jgi:hypothetical protein
MQSPCGGGRTVKALRPPPPTIFFLCNFFFNTFSLVILFLGHNWNFTRFGKKKKKNDEEVPEGVI